MRSRNRSHLWPQGLALIGTVICLSAVCLADEDGASAWTQWRGPSRDGHVQQNAWPATIASDTLKQAWRVELGPSYSGPIVAEGKVFTTETRDRKVEIVRAIDLATGKELWKTQWDGAIRVPFFARSNGDWIRSTPAYDEGNLYVGGMRDVLVCLDATTGETVWRTDFVKKLKTPVPAFGFVCSPLVIDDHVYVQAGASLAKVDKKTGEICWQSLKDGGGMYGSAFSSPVRGTLSGQEQLIVQTRTNLAGVDLDSGDVLWSQKIQAFRGMNILTPMVHENSVFTSSYGGRSHLFSILEKEDDWEVQQTWDNKAQGYMSSPVIIDGHVYMHLRNQRFTCINLANGESKWTSKPYGKYCSLVTNGKQILALDERGDLLLFNADGDEFNLVESREISDSSTWAHLAVSGKNIVVRELNGLSCYQW